MCYFLICPWRLSVIAESRMFLKTLIGCHSFSITCPWFRWWLLFWVFVLWGSDINFLNIIFHEVILLVTLTSLLKVVFSICWIGLIFSDICCNSVVADLLYLWKDLNWWQVPSRPPESQISTIVPEICNKSIVKSFKEKFYFV